MTDFWRDWIKTWCNMALVSGLIFVLAAFPVTDFFARAFYDFVYWPLDGKSDFSDAARPTIAILGAVFVAWAWLLRGVVHIALDNPIPPQSVALWRAITSSVVLWWVVDSGVSVACGILVNAVTNTLLLVTFLVPVMGSGVLRRAITKHEKGVVI